MAFESGQWGPDTFIDSEGATTLIGATVASVGYVCVVDSLGNLTITGPAADAIVFTVTPAAGAAYTVTLPVAPLVSELEDAQELALAAETPAGATAKAAAAVAADLARQNGTYVPNRRLRALLVGTSLEAQAGTGSSTLNPASPGTSAVSARGWWHWCNAYLEQSFHLTENAGISGSLSAAQLAALTVDLTDNDPDWVFIGGPVNDIANDVASATTLANLTAMWNACKARGARVVQLTCAPSTSYSTAGRRLALSVVNQAIRDAATSREITVVDIWPLLTDPATGSPATGMAIDAVHYSPQGAERVGRAVAAAVDPLVSKRPPRVLGLLDPVNVIGNPYFGSAGSGWSTLNGAAAAYSAAEDRGGNKASLSWSGVADATERGIQYIEPVGGGRYAAGDIIQMSARLRWSGMTPVGTSTVPCLPFLRLYPRLSDSSFGTPAFALAVASSEAPAGGGFPSSGEAVFITSRLTLPVDVANLFVAVGWQGAAAASIEVTDLAVRKGA